VKTTRPQRKRIAKEHLEKMWTVDLEWPTGEKMENSSTKQSWADRERKTCVACATLRATMH